MHWKSCLEMINVPIVVHLNQIGLPWILAFLYVLNALAFIAILVCIYPRQVDCSFLIVPKHFCPWIQLFSILMLMQVQGSVWFLPRMLITGHKIFDMYTLISRLSKLLMQVRSLTLDVKVWEPSVITLFQALGNVFVNSIWEGLLQASRTVQADEIPRR